MKKIIAIVLAVSSLFLLTATKVIADWSAGVSMTHGQFSATGKETEDGEINTLPSTNLVEGAFTFPSIFFEKNVGIVSIGLDFIPGTVDTEEQARTDINLGDALNGTGNDGGATGVTNKASVSISKHTTLYAVLQPLADIGAFVRVAVMRADVETKESLGTGSTYPDTTMKGGSISIGYQHNLDWGFVRAEAGRSAYETIKVTSTNGHTVEADLDGDKWGRISIGRTF